MLGSATAVGMATVGMMSPGNTTIRRTHRAKTVHMLTMVGFANVINPNIPIESDAAVHVVFTFIVSNHTYTIPAASLMGVVRPR